MSNQTLPSLSEIPRVVHECLEEFLDSRRPHVQAIGRPVAQATAFLDEFVLGGGKRIRPLYAWAGFVGASEPVGKEDPQAMIRAASSLELIQACALIHDDIIDASDTRRGRPTVHRGVEARHRAAGFVGDPALFGQSVAILVGDLALVWAEDMLQDSGLSAAALARAREPWRAMRTEVIGGQLLDVSLEAAGSEDIGLAQSVNRFKTAAYTIERPLHLGAAIAGANAETIAAFRGYGRDIGIAFQLRDDLLGVFGDPAVTGKPAGDDLREGKRTVLLSLALQRADATDPSAAQELRAGIGVCEDPRGLGRLTDIIASTGAAEEVEEEIARLRESGLQHLRKANIDPEVTRTLEQLAYTSTARSM